jgi:hypothetical protein
MKSILLNESLFRGAISVERTKAGFKPWRIPYEDYELFPPHGINGKAADAAGVRLELISSTASVKVEVSPSDKATAMDCVVNGELVSTCRLAEGETEALFGDLPLGEKHIELFLDQKTPVEVTGVWIEDSSSFELPADSRLRWVTYGSSITQCAAAASPSMTWPAIVARKNNLNLTCLGYGGNCMLEPMVARMIRELPADYLSLCMGINVYGNGSLNARSFKAAVIGLIQIIREKHPVTPIAAISPIFATLRETNENKVGFTLVQMREEIQEAVAILRQRGDEALTYVSGLELFGGQYVDYLPDNLHPNAEGYKILASNFDEKIVKSIWKLNS